MKKPQLKIKFVGFTPSIPKNERPFFQKLSSRYYLRDGLDYVIFNGIEGHYKYE